ncbi:hypothetical protein KJ633_04010 [bacterium]|nr:hypothetical protein [bacterium]MBU3955604.1 hypothetical protein [bacterium]MBU4134051.1 hypothetical protein [bacterium]
MDKERLENLVFDELLAISPKQKNIKRGFFAGNYLRNMAYQRPFSRALVTEADVREFLKTGARVMAMKKGSIITPLAVEMIDANFIKVEYERA